MSTLVEEMHLLFDEDESIKEWIIIGKLPPDIAELAAEALDGEHEKNMPISLLSAPDPYKYVAGVIQRKFWPNAPGLQKGGFMSMLAGGPAPNWVLIGQISDQIVNRAKAHGYEIEGEDND
jgi:hypothetical protein